MCPLTRGRRNNLYFGTRRMPLYYIVQRIDQMLSYRSSLNARHADLGIYNNIHDRHCRE